jgi:hypothetical protein
VEIHIKGLKMCKEMEHRHHSTQAQRARPITRQIRDQTKGKIRPNPNQIIISSRDTAMAQVKKPKGARPPKMG